VTDGQVVRRLEGGVAWIALNRPEVRNALSFATVGALREAIDWAATDEAVRAVVISGEGESFSSGIDRADLDELHTLSTHDVRARVYGTFQGVTESLIMMPKPVIAAVRGDAIGAGCEIALACDIRVATPATRFSEYFVRIGLVPAIAGLFLLPRIVGRGTANRLAFTGETIDGAEAYRIGLVDVLASEDDFVATVSGLAGKLAAGATAAIGLIKQGFRHSMLRDLRAELEYASALQAEALQTDDHAEALKAMHEDRKPRFRGR
jgi:2-(1,2-epoxy-1,2-dihydrophenyl)acetyl-CoA isomerase